MAKLVVEGEVVSGAVDNAASISCLDKDGNKSNVQAELNKKGSGGGAEVRKMTQAQFNALPEAQQKSGMYVITDADELSAKNMAYDDSVTGLGVNNVQDAVDTLNGNLSDVNALAKLLYNNKEIEVIGQISGNPNIAYFGLPLCCTPKTINILAAAAPNIGYLSGCTVNSIDNGVFTMVTNTTDSNMGKASVEATIQMIFD